MKKRLLRRLLLIAVLPACYSLPAPAQSAGPRPPNIIFIISDDQGYGDLGVLFQNARAKTAGGALPVERTPHLDRLAAEGALFSQYYCAAPICAPSRSSLLLGVSQGHANVRDNQFDKALEDNYTMSSTLRRLGYHTAAIGKWGLQGNDKYDADGYQWPAHPLRRGFDSFFGYMRHSDGHEHYPKEALYRKYWAENGKAVWQDTLNITPALDNCYTADLWTAAAKKYIIDHVRDATSAQPFFIYLAYDTPHAVQELPTGPYPAGGGLKGGLQWLGIPGRFINTAGGTPDSYIYPDYAAATYDHDQDARTPPVGWPETYKRYATANRRIDDAVGDILQLLRDLKIDSSTLVVYTSDNGPSRESYLPEEKYAANEPTFFSSFGPFEGVKGDVWEGGVRLPALAWWPGHIAPGKTIDLPAIAYDWAPTFLAAAGQPPPARMDGVSLLPALTGRGAQQEPLVYIEYRGEGTTPDYPAFSPRRRGRIRNQMQLLRLGSYVGVRYDVRSVEDDFEIYNVVADPRQRQNLARPGGPSLPVSLPGAGSGLFDIGRLQAYWKARVLQVRKSDPGAPRPYDSTLVPSLPIVAPIPGIQWKIYRGPFPWIPQVQTLPVQEEGTAAFPGLSEKGEKPNTLTYFEGYLAVPRDGAYQFYMSCDARAFLRIHDIQVIDADYRYPGNLLRTGRLLLKAGLHPVRLYYYRQEQQGPAFLKLDWSGPGFTRQRVPASAFFQETGKR